MRSLPTYGRYARFIRDFESLTADQQELFRKAVRKFIEDLRAGAGFRKSLRVKPIQGKDGVWEMTWSMGSFDGRATFEYGDEVVDGETHVIWRRIGGHDIFKDA